MIMTVRDMRDMFVHEYVAGNFIKDRSGQNMIEVLGASFIADEPAIFGTPNEEYIKAELDWYESESTNINDIYGDGREPPAAWKATANLHGEINSNYGYLVFSDKFNNQFERVVNELIENSSSRRASMIYTRPSIWVDYSDNGKNDFICTNAVTYYIRDSQLHCVVQMRSNDAIYGYKNDYAWQQHLLESICDRYLDLNIFADLNPGNIYWQVQNLHVYERHFGLIK
jgi:thymidylate synthase